MTDPNEEIPMTDPTDLAPCGCPLPLIRDGEHQAGCRTSPDEHEVTVTQMVGAGPGNWVASCTCGRTGSMAGPATLVLARDRQENTPADHARDLQWEVGNFLARLDLDAITSRAEAIRLLADHGRWRGEAPAVDDTGAIRHAYADAWGDRPTCTGSWTKAHADMALAIALGEIHPPAADPELHEDVVTIDVPVRWSGDGPGPKAEDVMGELLARVPHHLTILDAGDPEGWAIGTPTVAGSAPLFVDLTRPNEGGPVRLEFGEHWEPGWYVIDHRPEVPAYFGPIRQGKSVALISPGFALRPGMTTTWLGPWPTEDAEADASS